MQKEKGLLHKHEAILFVVTFFPFTEFYTGTPGKAIKARAQSKA